MKLINTSSDSFNNIKLGQKDGVVIEKGVALSETYLESIQPNLEDIVSIFTAYPDIYLDIITPENEEISLFFYQRIILRALMRYKEIYWTACRATSKTFLSILALFLQCVFMPNTKRFIVAPHKNQAAKVAKEHGIQSVEVFVKGPGSGRELAIRSLQNCELNVTMIKDVSPIAHNGCRPPKTRRI